MYKELKKELELLVEKCYTLGLTPVSENLEEALIDLEHAKENNLI